MTTTQRTGGSVKSKSILESDDRSTKSSSSNKTSRTLAADKKGIAAIAGICVAVIFLFGIGETGSMLRGSGNSYQKAQTEVKSLLEEADTEASQAFFDPNYEPEEPINDISTNENMQLDPEDPNDCIIRSAEDNADTHITPTFAASFPGSGARMTWNLITALTGQVTAEDWQISQPADIYRVAAIKTHHPHPHGREYPTIEDVGTEKDWGAREIHRGMILLRNPLDAIPSFHNYLYEVEQQLDGHSTRAPVEAWIKWRETPGDILCVRYPTTGYHDGDIVRAMQPSDAPNGANWFWKDCAKYCGMEKECEFWTLERSGEQQCLLKKNKGDYHEVFDENNDYREGDHHMDCIYQTNFVQELRFWERFVAFWMARFHKDDRIIMSYEGFTGQDTGADASVKLADFLRKGESGLDVVKTEQVPCVWEKVVNYGKASNPVMEVPKAEEESRRRLPKAEEESGRRLPKAEKESRRRLQAVPISYDRTQLRTDGIAMTMDPSHPASIRSGNKIRPYTQQQLDLTVAMLERIIKNYPDETELVDICNSYVEQVKSRQAEG